MSIRDIGSPRFRLQLNSDAYSEHSRISKMELFSKTATEFNLLTIFTKTPSYMADWIMDAPLKLSVSCSFTETQLLNFYF